MFFPRWLFVLAMAVSAYAQTVCNCDPAKPETMKARQCSLCEEAEKQPAGAEFFVVKDANPSKPNRTLLLPREHTPGQHPLRDLTAEQRTAFWSAAVDKARQLWGDDWAVAWNSDRVRTQCHAHLHIGKLLPGVETENFIVVNSPSEIPLPKDVNDGIWVHQVNGKLHVHTGEIITETVLLR
jgi:diadenosine tetraphosphate (Ap4A) HIT family hydrolase